MLNLDLLKRLYRYGIVGLSLNSVAYLLYLFFTGVGVDPKVVAGFLYPLGALISYLANKEWSFSHKKRFQESLGKYLIFHFFCCGINLGALYFFVDVLGYRHELVQVAAIFFVAFFLFIGMDKFVFPKDKRDV